MLGKRGTYSEQCFTGNFVGADFGITQDLSHSLPEEWKSFNREFISVWLQGHPGKSRVAAGLACGFLWTVSKGINIGDLVLCPDGTGRYRIGEVNGDYYYDPGTVLPHRRSVKWLSRIVDRAEMSKALRNSTGSIGTVSNITKYHEEIERLICGVASPTLVAPDEVVEDVAAFAMEKHLEEFLVKNWDQTDLGKEYDIYEEDEELVGQQYATDTGPLDILAVSKDKKCLLVVELKKGRASDVVVGQTLRYMGYVKEELAEEGQVVKGVIIALEDDPRIRRALSLVPSILFYRYEIKFKLVQV